MVGWRLPAGSRSRPRTKVVCRARKEPALPPAYHGVLFLDELPEFHRCSLKMLRHALEQGLVTNTKAPQSNTFPALYEPEVPPANAMLSQCGGRGLQQEHDW
jgi:predicted ATPase with chaperone activity